MIFLKNIVLFALGYFQLVCAFAQTNLVPDPSFEILDSCPSGNGQISRLLFWDIPKNGGGGNPELFNSCSSDPFSSGVPLNSFNSSFQYANTGESYVGIDVAFYNGTLREYIQTKLLDTLKTGNIYCVTFYASLKDYCNAYIEPLGAYLDSGEIYAPTTFGLAVANPQVFNTNGQLSDTLSWMKIEGSFVATGIETYITIGNYFDNSSSNIGFFGSPPSWASYYYIDDVSVIDVSTLAFAGNDTIIRPGDSIYIGRPSEIGLNEDCVWYNETVPIDTIAGMWVTPQITTYYVLEQTICGVVSYDTINITVDSTLGIIQNNFETAIKLFPNPNSGHFSIELSQIGNYSIEIFDNIGKCVFKNKTNLSLYNIDATLSDGIYVLKVSELDKDVTAFKKLVIQSN